MKAKVKKNFVLVKAIVLLCFFSLTAFQTADHTKPSAVVEQTVEENKKPSDGSKKPQEKSRRRRTIRDVLPEILLIEYLQMNLAKYHSV